MKISIITLLLTLLSIQSSLATLTIILKDPTSADMAGGIISSNGNITDENLNWLMPSEKSIGITAWGGAPSFFRETLAAEVIKMMKRGASSSEIEKYVVQQNGSGYYRYVFMNNAGALKGAVAPYCDSTHLDCAFYQDDSSSVVIAAGGQEPGSILKTFNEIKSMQAERRKNFQNGMPVQAFACYMAKVMGVSQLFGAETAVLHAAGITLDLKSSAQLIRFTDAEPVENQIIPALIGKVETGLHVSCKD